MTKLTTTLTHVALLAVLGIASANSFATGFQYRVSNPGIRSSSSGAPATGGTTTSGGTGGSSSSATTPGGTGSGGTTADPIYATSGVQFFRDGSAITEIILADSGTEYTLAIRNGSTYPLHGWLTNPAGGQAVVDMARSDCGQNVSTGQPTILAPGAACSFVLISKVAKWNSHPSDVLAFKGLDNTVIPGTLSIPEAVTTTPGGGTGATPIGGL